MKCLVLVVICLLSVKSAQCHRLSRNTLIDREEKYDGFYAVATNLHDEVKAILDISDNRQKIKKIQETV